MICYTFNNMYLAGPHIGIQTAHAVARLSIAYDGYPEMQKMYKLWAEKFETIVALNGGDHRKLCDLRDFLLNNDLEIPWATFREVGLNGTITSIATIIPSHLVEWAMAIRNKNTNYRPANAHKMGGKYYQYEELCTLIAKSRTLR